MIGIPTIPPVTVVAVPSKHGSFGYGAKVHQDGRILIPYNKSVVDVLTANDVRYRTYSMLREHFNELPEYTGE